MIELFIVEEGVLDSRLGVKNNYLIIKSWSEVDRYGVRVSASRCVVVGSTSEFLDAAHAAEIPIIVFKVDSTNRGKYQRKYRPLYICDTATELSEFFNSYSQASVEDIRGINKDLELPLIATKSLKSAEQEVLGKTLFSVYQRMLQGKNEKSFIALLSDNKPTFIEVLSYVNRLGKVVGFVIVSGHLMQFARDHYMVCEALACMLPEIQNNKYVEDGLMMMLDEYHQRNPEINIVLFDLSVNYKSYKIVLKSRGPKPISTFPHPAFPTPSIVDAFMRYLKEYFCYCTVNDSPYTGKTISDVYVKEFPSNAEDHAWVFYHYHTGNQPHVGLLFLSCYYLTPNNSLELPTQSQFSYDECFGDQGAQICSRRNARKEAERVGNHTRRQTGKLFLLSLIFKKEMVHLTPVLADLPNADLRRTSLLWYSYFSRGIFLSAGGASESFVKRDDLTSNKNLVSFNQYRSDRGGSVVISSGEIATFLTEEKLLSSTVCLEDLTFSFCLGGHEGVTRLGRNLYDPRKNNTLFCLVGSYGFLAASMAAMRPASYKVRLVDIERFNGEKISLANFVQQIKKYPTAKTLFLELKTTCGAIYTSAEIKQIIKICMENNIFVVFDAAHINMHYEECDAFPDVIGICQQVNYHDFAVVYTASKTYGLERARVGFVVLSKKSRIPDFWIKMEMDLYRVLGSLGDMPFEIARILFDSPFITRQLFMRETAKQLSYNSNLMIAYIEGVDSPLVDEHVREQIRREIPSEYSCGMSGICLVYKPQGGVQLKANMSALQNKYFANMRMSSAEIFGYVLNKMADVVILNSYQILDPEGFGMRLGYAIKSDVHQGMQVMHNFVRSLGDAPCFNRFLFGCKTLEASIVEERERKEEKVVLHSKLNLALVHHSLFSAYKRNIQKRLPSYIKLSDKELENAVNNAATRIKRKWKMVSRKKYQSGSSKKNSNVFKSKL